jgi:hypothetical protein
MITKAILTAGKSQLEQKVLGIAEKLTHEEQLVLGFLLEKIGSQLKEAGTQNLCETVTFGHVKAVYVKESITTKNDFSADPKWLKMKADIEAYEKKIVGKVPTIPSVKKSHFRFTYTG